MVARRLVELLGVVALALAVAGCADAAASAPAVAAPAAQPSPPPVPRQIKFGPGQGNGPAIYGVSMSPIDGAMVIPPGEYGTPGRFSVGGQCRYERRSIPDAVLIEGAVVFGVSDWTFFTANVGEAVVIAGPCTWYSGASVRAGRVQ